MVTFEADAVKADVTTLNNEGAEPGSSLHSWRCEYPERFGPCTCTEQTAKEIVAVLVPMLRAHIADGIRQLGHHVDCDAYAPLYDDPRDLRARITGEPCSCGIEDAVRIAEGRMEEDPR
jgi:hypothetical protein